mmetsp:Transcript_70525/g.153186  ORF Transcript_70525/g.153186 Transcript_70525/m.153186 type:complete len:107 (-) Transcript_70525:636-956(-)
MAGDLIGMDCVPDMLGVIDRVVMAGDLIGIDRLPEPPLLDLTMGPGLAIVPGIAVARGPLHRSLELGTSRGPFETSPQTALSVVVVSGCTSLWTGSGLGMGSAILL